MSRKTRNELHPLLGLLSFVIPLVLQGLFLYHQIKNDILTLWNLVASGMMVLIFINAIRMMFGKKNEEETAEKIQGESTVEVTGPERKTVFTVTQAIVAVVAIALSVVFFRVYDNKTNGLEMVNSNVVSQWGETKKEIKYEDDGVTETETEYIEVTISYEYKGVKHRDVVTSGTTSKIYVDELKIYVDENGTLMGTYGQFEVWKYEAIVLLVFGVIMLFSAIFVLGAGFVAGNIMTSAGLGIFFWIGSAFLENILYNDILCFVSMFVNIGFYMLLYSVLTLIFVGRKGLAGAITTTTTYVDHIEDLDDLIDEEDMYTPNSSPMVEQKEEPVQKAQYCKYCGSELLPGANFCDMCGSKMGPHEE